MEKLKRGMTEKAYDTKSIQTELEEILADSQGKGKKTKKDRPDRGIETMFRVTSTNNQRLSDQADGKANILITVNTIIISILLGTVVRQMNYDNNLVIPSIMLIATSLITIIFSILATRPRIPKGTFTEQELKAKEINLLFFGNYYRMSIEHYAAGIFEMMDDRKHLYWGLVRDVHSQGAVLGRKYRLLESAYHTFLFGFVISVIAFVIASLFSVQ